MGTSEKRGGEVVLHLRPPIEEEEPMMAQVATERHNGVAANGTVDVRGDTLVVNVNKRDKASMFTPTIRIPIDHVLGAEKDAQIERMQWRAWVLRGFKPGTYEAPDQAVRFYNPRYLLAHKAIVIRLKDEGYERLVVEVEDPNGVVERINGAVRAFSGGLSLV
jgi:hypothetical protein